MQEEGLVGRARGRHRHTTNCSFVLDSWGKTDVIGTIGSITKTIRMPSREGAAADTCRRQYNDSLASGLYTLAPRPHCPG